MSPAVRAPGGCLLDCGVLPSTGLTLTLSCDLVCVNDMTREEAFGAQYRRSRTSLGARVSGVFGGPRESHPLLRDLISDWDALRVPTASPIIQ